ncbi:MAG: PBP1A family penicillin-binding protein [Magnetococcales bacterium]|nr:PBP1A family penicillin-binding protein [Magnetococcales bacterium]
MPVNTAQAKPAAKKPATVRAGKKQVRPSTQAAKPASIPKSTRNANATTRSTQAVKATRTKKTASAKPPGSVRRPAKPALSSGLGQKISQKTFAFFRRILLKLTVLIFIGLVLAGLLVAIFWPMLPTRQQIVDADRGLSLIMEKSGNNLEMVEVSRNLRLPGNQIPDHLKAAFIAIEDRRFHYHFGVDPISIVTNVIKGLQGQRMAGASTLTQQLAKNLFLSSDRSLWRKFKEMVLSFKLEYYFSKERIIEMYLNNVYFGDNTYGVETAARQYFSKRTSELNLFEAALLAGTVKGPNRYHIRRHYDLAASRAKTVLQSMVRGDYISSDDQEQAIQTGIQKGDRQFRPIQYQWLKDWITPSLIDKLGDYEGRIRVFTTLNTEYQTYAEIAISRYLREYKGRKTSQAALVSIAADGAVRAMVGGADYGDSQLNRCLVKRQPASTFKPFVFLAGLEAGLDENSRVEDLPVTIDGWSPRNYDGRFMGSMSLTEALTQSRNTVSVALYQQVGHNALVDLLFRLGIGEILPDNPSVALGSWEIPLLNLTSMYRTIANGGARFEPYGYTGVTDASGNILTWRMQREPFYAIDLAVAAQLNGMLQRVVYKGTARNAAFGKKPIAGKTGTSQDNRDAFFIGYSDILTTGVWMGNDDNTPMQGVTGGGPPALIWRYFMSNCHNSLYE